MVYSGNYSHDAKRSDPAHARKRGKAAVSWWTKDWLSLIESVCSWESASRGKDHARKGDVYDVGLKPLRIDAKVEGSSGEEYSVSIVCPSLSAMDRFKLSSIIRKSDVSLRLLSNELYKDYRERLAPFLYKGLCFGCDCPGKRKACEHVAAVFYVLAGEIDAAPQILLYLRGMENDELLSLIREGMHETSEMGGRRK
jgi:uncharacterized Zn finger protein